ncbi:competence protein ComK [Gracilibacillus boraciitolerans]|uniref:competence protein ComK n=1 Tax=Gracilibacillus boraciitolerans TaxID=307521 RepID=UPI00069021D2|nr:competence protein ComK [Gracilibacillus boraciitolerans]
MTVRRGKRNDAPTYRITSNTLALLPAIDIDYQTRIIEQDGERYVTSPPFAIIKENCIHYGASYEGRKKSVQHHLAFQQKTPIPIYPDKQLFAFSTEAATSYTCVWLLFHAITQIESISSTQSRIHFINQQTIILPISTYVSRKHRKSTTIN